MLSRDKKTKQVEQLSKGFSRSKASFLVNCIGLSVEDMTKLRKSLKEQNGNIQVIRNTLSLRAMEGSEILKKTYSPQLKGPNAFVLAFEDSVKVAKIIDDFSKDHELFKIKGAVLEGSALEPQEVKALAQLPPKEVLKAQFLGLLAQPLTQFVRTIKEVPQAFVRVIGAKKDKK